MPGIKPLKSCALGLILAFTLTLSHALEAQESWSQISDYGGPTCMADGGDNLWIGSPGGLVRLHKPTGRKTYFNLFNSGLTDTRILSLAVDGGGTLWVGTEAGGLAAFDGRAWTRFDSTNSPLRKPGVALLARDTGSGIWILARSSGFGDSIPQLFHKRGGDWKPVVLPARTGILAGSDKWAAMGTDPSGSLWIESTWGYYGTSHRALMRVDGSGNVTTLPPPDADDVRFALVAGNGDILWFYSRLVKRQSGTLSGTLALPQYLSSWISDGSLQNAYLRTPDGSEFLTVGGLRRLEDGRWDTASIPHGLKASATEIRVVGDGQGGAWFAYSDGSVRHWRPGGGILRDTLYSPLPSTFIQSLLPLSKPALPEAWVNTGNRLLRIRLDPEASAILPVPSLPRLAGASMAEDAEGRIWLDSDHGPVRMESDGAWSRPTGAGAELFPLSDPLRPYPGRSLFELDAAGTLWIADFEGLVSLPADPDATGKRYRHPFFQVREESPYDHPFDKSVQGLAICGDGDRWLSGVSHYRKSLSGSFLSRLRDGAWTHFDSTDHPWLGTQSRQLACDGAGRLWASMPQGLLRWDGETWQSFAAIRSNPHAHVVVPMAVDPQGRLWAAGLSIDAPLRMFAETGWVADEDAAAKLRNVSISSMKFDGAGRLWLGTDGHGLFMRGVSPAGNGLARLDRALPVRPGSGSNRLVFAKAGAGSWRISVEDLPAPASGSSARASIHDSRGRLAWSSGDGTPGASSMVWTWDGKDRDGTPLSPGRYYLSAATASGAIGSRTFLHPGR